MKKLKIHIIFLLLPSIAISQNRGLNLTSDSETMLLNDGANPDTINLKLRTVQQIGNTAELVPSGTTGTRPTGFPGYFRHNKTTGKYEGVLSGTTWVNFLTSADAVGITGSGLNTQVTYWTGASAISGSNNLLFDGTILTLTGRKTILSTSSFSADNNFLGVSGTATTTANGVDIAGVNSTLVAANDGTPTSNSFTGGKFNISTNTTTAGIVYGVNTGGVNTSPNVSQFYGLNARLDENSATGNLSNRYGMDFLLVKGAQDAADAHSMTGFRIRLQEITASGRILNGIGGTVSVENSVNGTGFSITVSNAKGINATQFGQVITNTATGSGVTVANAYGTRYIPSENSSGSITNYYSILNNTAPVATNSWFLYNSQDYRNYLNGNLAIGVDVTSAKLFVRGTGATSATLSATFENSSGSDIMNLRDDQRVGIITASPNRTLEVQGEVRITDLVTDTPTRIVGADADGDLDTVGIGAEAELHITNGTLGTHFHTTISPSQLTAGTTNNWNPTGLSTAWIIRLSGDDGFEVITGITAPTFNKYLTLINVGSNCVLLANKSSLSTAGNTFLFQRDLVLYPDMAVTLQYDVTSSRWRLRSVQNDNDVSHITLNQSFSAPVSIASADYDFWDITSVDVATAVTPAAGLFRGVAVNTGTSASGCGYVASKEQFFENTNASGSADWAYCRAVIKTPSSLSDGTNDYTLRIGFLGTTCGGNAQDGMYFDYNHSTVSGNWGCNTTNAGNNQKNNSGIAVAASTTYVLEVMFRPNGSAEFFINGSRVATNDTHVPYATGDDMKLVAEIEKSLGTTQRDLQVFTLQTTVVLVNQP